jgi:hypothetical protein
MTFQLILFTILLCMLKKLLLIIIAVSAVLATSWALWNPNFFRIHDYVHAARIAEMTRALQDGHFPVRWSRNFGYGYGMPLFEFYAPLPYYVGSLFYWVGVPIVVAIKLLFIICTLFTFIGMYRLGSRLFGRAGGILSALALTLAPYRAVNLYVRGALSEAWGIMALPWVLLGIVQIVRKEKGGWLTLLLGLLMLFLSHNITTMLFIPISILFGLGIWSLSLFNPIQYKNTKEKIVVKKTAPKKTFFTKFANVEYLVISALKIAGTYALGIGLAAFYLFPAFLEKDATKVNRIFGGYFSYGLHFLYIRQFFIPNWGYGGSTWGPDDGLSFFLGYGQLIGLGVVILLLAREVIIRLLQSREDKNASKKLLTSLILFTTLFVPLVLSLFMTLLKSKPIWDAISFLAVAQFPWRWLSVAITFLALLAGLGTRFIRQSWLRWGYVAVLGAFIVTSNLAYFQPAAYLTDADSFYYTDGKRIREAMSNVLNDYIPVQMADPLTAVDTVVTNPILNEKDASLKVLVDRTQEKLIATQFAQPTKVEFAVADFPGWKTLLDGQPVTLEHGLVGNIAVQVPAGDHLVSVQFGETPTRGVSDAISLFSLVVFCFVMIQLPVQRKTYD